MPPPPIRATIGDHDTTVGDLVDFIDDYQGRSAAKRSTLNRKSCKVTARPSDADDSAMVAIDYAALAREERESVAERLRFGFTWKNERTFGSDYFLPPFVEYGLRSWNDPIDKMFVAAAPKARKLQCGPRKDSAFIRRRKIQALDQPYVRFNQIVRFGWRIDFDHSFNGIEDFIKRWKMRVRGFLPHKVVGHINADGDLIRPHAWVLLGPGNALWYDRSDPRCNTGAMWLYDHVGLGIVDRLKDIGADPAAMGDPVRGKNPLSPLWSAWTANSTDFRTMHGCAQLFGLGRGRDIQIREAAEQKSGLGELGSNQLFTELRREAWETLKDMAAGEDPEYLACIGDRALLGDLLESRLGRSSRSAFDCRPSQVMAVLRRVVSYAACEWDPKRAEEEKVIRGALRGQLQPHMTLHDRQSAGGRHSGAIRAEKSVETIGKAIIDAKAAGESITKSLIARKTGLSRPTVHARWSAALCYADDCKVRCIVKRQPASRPVHMLVPHLPPETYEYGQMPPSEQFQERSPETRQVEFHTTSTRNSIGASHPTDDPPLTSAKGIDDGCALASFSESSNWVRPRFLQQTH